MPWIGNFVSPEGQDFQYQRGEENPYGVGGRNGFLPPLGTKLWVGSEEGVFDAYVYRSKNDGKVIGYVRIPSYMPGGKEEDKSATVRALWQFSHLIAEFQEKTDALVIDQLNNPGGSLFYLYALASMLSDQALAAPRHRIALTQNDVAEAASLVQLDKIENDEEARKELGLFFEGYPVSHQLVRHLVDFGRFVISEWSSGHTLTSPTYLHGVDYINPFPELHLPEIDFPKAHYTKPILVLVNQLDFSGGDFFPAILQDNHRAKIFGARTAGAGGFVRSVDYPNRLGIKQFSVTGSIAERVDHNPIENLGVRPDIEYQVTESDLQNQYKDYIEAVNKAISQMAGSDSPASQPAPNQPLPTPPQIPYIPY